MRLFVCTVPKGKQAGPSFWRSLASEVEKGEAHTNYQNNSVRVLLAELKRCSSTKNLQRGKEVHAQAVQTGSDHNIYVASTLVNMYAKCRDMLSARQVFDRMKHPSLVSWNALISGYAENGEGQVALDLFARMRSEGYVPNYITFVAALKACASLGLTLEGKERAECRERGKDIHLLARATGCDLQSRVQGTLIDMYAKCGSIWDARVVFNSMKNPDVVSWTALISGYTANGEGITALELFAWMRSQGCTPNSRTLVAALKACTSLAVKQNGKTDCRERGQQLHALASEFGYDADIFVQSSLIDMYAKCGCMGDAQSVFNTMKHPDVVSWNALLLGYAENGDGATALDMLTRMKSQGCGPNSVTFLAALKACSLIGALETGKEIHAEMAAAIHEPGVVLVTCLVDFYAKCGSLVEAQKVFDSHSRTRALATWNALLAGHSRLGDSKAMFALFQALQDAGLPPDNVTFMSLLTCCSHAGLVEKGKECFEAMIKKYRLVPTVEHYTCMVDILGRSNRLDEAMELLRTMPCSPDAVTWMTVLGACRKWKNVEIGRVAFESLISLDGTNAAAYVLMAQIYGSRGMWEEQEMVLRLRSNLTGWRRPGQSWLREALDR